MSDRTGSDPARGESGWVGSVVRFLLILAILGAGCGLSWYWFENRPKARRRRPARSAPLVEVTPVRVGTHEVVVHAMGTVVPARHVSLTSRVAGQIVETAPEYVPGGRFREGEVILRIDPADYELAVQQALAEQSRRAAEREQRTNDIAERELDIEVAQIQIDRSARQIELRQTAVVRADSALQLEKGQQQVALREYELLGQTVTAEDRELVLRQPQLKSIKADYEAAVASKQVATVDRLAAEAAKRAAGLRKRTAESALAAAEALETAAGSLLAKAQLDLERTRVRAAFNALVVDRKVDLGSHVGMGTGLASLVATDTYWVQVSVPVDQLRRIRIPGFNGAEASAVRVYHDAGWGVGVFRTGTVERLMSALETAGRMAQLLVSVQDPLGLADGAAAHPPLILGSYVRVEIMGEQLQSVARVDRSAIHDGSRVWVMLPDRTLAIREVTVGWSSAEAVFVSAGLSEGERLITSDLGAPVPGMALRTADDAPPARTGKPGPPRKDKGEE